MKFVALVSGGKDSCFNVIHCLKQGHELVALANLHPADRTQQELDSYMFQTVGHDIVPYYSQCTGLPLFRKAINPAGSKNVDLNYTPTLDDEIEDLYDLLSQVLRKIPDLEAVSVGAILSSYQRTRVEDVCARLSLVALSFLWQRDQLELMQEMCLMSSQEKGESDRGKLEARLIKVASIGLDQSSLGKTLPEVLPTLIKLHQMYDVHICGEGGEFETMVLDAPFFFKGRLRLVSQDFTSHDSNDGVYNTRLNVEFEEREFSKSDLQLHLDALPIPNLLDAKWKELYESVKEVENIQILPRKSLALEYTAYKRSVAQVGNLLFVSNLCSTAVTLERQLEEIFNDLESTLTDYKITSSRALHCSLILVDMSLFARVNEIYSRYFDVWKHGPLPPARACVASKMLSKGCLIQLSLTLDISSGHELSRNKNGLHVQGRSYWAPSNIGPYSQATWLQNDPNKIAFISGQIALEPASMSLNASNFTIEAVLSLRHFDTLKATIRTKRQLFMVCMISKTELIPTVARTWSLYCSDMADEPEQWMDKEEDTRECLIIVKISKLPKNALCEWSGVSCEHLTIEEDDTYGDVKKPLGNLLLQNVKDITVSNAQIQKHFITGFTDNRLDLLRISKLMPKASKMTLYFSPENASLDLLDLPNTEFFPVEIVYNYKGHSHRYGFHIIF